MNRRIVLLCSVLMVAALSGGRPARAGDSSGPPDFTGDWRLDPKHSDMPQRSGEGGSGRGGHMGHGGWGGGGGGGGWRGHGGRRGGGEGGAGGDQGGSATGAEARPARLPDLIHVTQTATTVSFADTSGAVLREVAAGPAEADTLPRTQGAEHLSGQWKGSKLVIERTGPRDSKITETISLQDKGKSLLIDTKFQSSGDAPSREFKRVYNRVSQT